MSQVSAAGPSHKPDSSSVCVYEKLTSEKWWFHLLWPWPTYQTRKWTFHYVKPGCAAAAAPRQRQHWKTGCAKIFIAWHTAPVHGITASLFCCQVYYLLWGSRLRRGASGLPFKNSEGRVERTTTQQQNSDYNEYCVVGSRRCVNSTGFLICQFLELCLWSCCQACQIDVLQRLCLPRILILFLFHDTIQNWLESFFDSISRLCFVFKKKIQRSNFRPTFSHSLVGFSFS